MKKQQFNCIEAKQLSQILGGISDPLEDPEELFVVPVKDPVSPNNPTDKEPNPRTQSRG